MITAPTLAGYTAAATHIEQARIASGLTNEQFASWLRVIAKDIENVGERALQRPV
ncbi:hypothetical protein [Kaistia terrae]|uniref:Uncharacterized protein n=1 Tax=Kaistia terrae TaxID=537017 RepID=A0ABW0Q2D5_9HYPH|nr:hypothetical protein [Kaistia terrae]MCX5581477.1 hypothetical protein [Kaistia terrae]